MPGHLSYRIYATPIIHLNSGHTWFVESHSATDDNLILYAKDIINTIPVNSCSRCKYFGVSTTGNNWDEPRESEPYCGHPDENVKDGFYDGCESNKSENEIYIAIASQCPGYEFYDWAAVEQARVDAEYQEYLQSEQYGLNLAITHHDNDPFYIPVPEDRD
ncbi:MAG TPA: hypothetical protein VK203_19610 [Nostocaceae cyanobacterium]|nr:hypothetical protein [Nostocaceae cyanobacterium]